MLLFYKELKSLNLHNALLAWIPLLYVRSAIQLPRSPLIQCSYLPSAF